MILKGFKITSHVRIEASKSCGCGGKLHTVSNGIFSECFFCEKCESVYVIKMVKAPKKIVTKEFIEQAREEIKADKI